MMERRVIEAANADLPEGFLELPSLVYSDDPMWVPETPDAIARAFSTSNPWYADGGESAAFCIPGAARLATFVSPHTAIDGERAVYFGYWETTGEEAADDAIFARATEWAVEKGAETICGPINFSTFGKSRLRLRVEEGGTTFANEPYNPPYYPDVLERLGFERVAEAVTQLGDAETCDAIRRARLPTLEAVLERGIRIEAFRHEIWLDRLEEIHRFINTTFRNNWGYTPISLATFTRVCGEGFVQKLCPIASTVAFDPDDRIIGFFLVNPHWGPLIVQGAGDRRVPLEEISYEKHWPLLLETGEVKAVAKTIATLPSAQNQGVFYALACELIRRGLEVYSHFFGALIHANELSRRYADGPTDDARWYAAYRKSLDAPFT